MICTINQRSINTIYE